MANAITNTGYLTEIMNYALLDKEAILQIFNSHPMVKETMKNSITADGAVVQDIVAVKELTAHNYIRGNQYGSGVPDALKAVQWNFHNFDVDVSLPKTTVRQSQSNQALVNLVNTYRNIAMETANKTLELMMLGVALGGFVDPIASFPDIANIDRSYGGLNSSTAGYEAWDGFRVAGTTVMSSTATNVLVANENILNMCEYVVTEVSDIGEKESTDAIFCGPLMWRCFGYYGYTNYAPVTPDTSMKWGSMVRNFNNTKIVLNKNIPDSLGYLYFVNFDYLDLVLSDGFNFEFTGYTDDPNSDKMIGHILVSGELICTQPRRQGLVTGLATSWTNPS